MLCVVYRGLGGLTVDIALKVLLVIVSLGLLLVVLLQQGKSAGLSGAISGGAEHLSGKQRRVGIDLVPSRLTGCVQCLFVLLMCGIGIFRYR